MKLRFSIKLFITLFIWSSTVICIAKEVQIDKTEVTVNQYKDCVSDGACSASNLSTSEWGPSDQCNWGKFSKRNHPINCINYFEADKFCKWKNKRLPTNEEWSQLSAGYEYKKFPWGDTQPKNQLCWNKADTSGTCEVASYENGQSASGHFDLAGNVWEWTATKTCNTCNQMVTKGGAWGGNWSTSVIEKFSPSFDGADHPETRGSYLGFRCASGEIEINQNDISLNKQRLVLPIDFVVILNSSGNGNPLWNSNWIERLLNKSSSLLHGDIQFTIGKLEFINDDVAFNSLQQRYILNEILEKKAVFGKVTVAISHPQAKDSAGLAHQESFDRGFRGKLVIRSRKNNGSAEDLYESSAIFLHELGHTLGFSHGGSSDKMPYITDGWWDIPEARSKLGKLAQWAEINRNNLNDSLINQFSCKTGSPVPDTNQMFDPPTDAENILECVSRCNADINCVAVAQPTSSKSRCFMYSQGAQIIKKQGWSNVNTCWRK